MQSITEGSLTFEFPDDWQITKYDDWEFYRNQFIKIQDGLKALDILAIDASRTLWLIEVRDYRQHKRTKTIDLADEIALKVLYTLASLLPAKLSTLSNNPNEKNFAQNALQAKEIKIVLHLEQVTKHSKLRPRAINSIDIKEKLRAKLKAIDPHSLVVEMVKVQNLPWTVSSLT
jgi:hypothetical protein